MRPESRENSAIDIESAKTMWFFKIALPVIIILVTALGASLIMVLLTFAAWKLKMTFYQTVLIFAGLAALLGFAGFIYQKIYKKHK